MKQNLKSLITVLVVNVLSWCEFIIYVELSPIIAKVFFPNLGLQKSLFMTLLVTSFAFLARIAGGMFFGRMADKKGSGGALMYSVILMSIATVCIALLPSYQSIGIMSVVFLTLIRLLQAFCIGGEFGSSIAFLMQIAPKNKTGIYGALPMFGMGIGVIFASLIALILKYLPQEFVYTFGWKIPFLITGSLGLVSLYLRKNKQTQPSTNSERFSIKNNLGKIISSISLFACSMFHAYLFCLLVKTICLSNNIQLQNEFYIFGIASLMIFSLLGGKIAHFKYWHYVFYISIILMPIFTFFIFVKQNIYLLGLAAGVTGLVHGMIPKILYDNLPKHHLTTSLSLINNLTAVIFGSSLIVILQPLSIKWLFITSIFVCIVTMFGVYKHSPKTIA